MNEIAFFSKAQALGRADRNFFGWPVWTDMLFSCPVLFDFLWPHGLQHARLPCPSPSPGVWSNSCTLSRWCHPTISSFVSPFSSCLQSFPAPGSFPVSRLFASGGQSIVASASAIVLPISIQGWFPWGWTGLISLLSKESDRRPAICLMFQSTNIRWVSTLCPALFSVLGILRTE